MLFCISLIPVDTKLSLVSDTESAFVYLNPYFKKTGTQYRRGYVLPYVENFEDLFDSNNITGGNFIFVDIQKDIRLVSSSSKDFSWYGNSNTITNDANLAENLNLPKLSAKFSRVRCFKNKLELIRDDIKKNIMQQVGDTKENLIQLIKQNILDIYKQTQCRAGIFTAGRDTGLINVLGREILDRLYIPKLIYDKLNNLQREQLRLHHKLIVIDVETFEQMGLVNPLIPDKHGINYHRYMFPIPQEDVVFTGLYGETTLIPNLRYIELLCNKLNYFPSLIEYLKNYVRYNKPGSLLDPTCTGISKTNIVADLVELWYNVRLVSSFESKLWVDPYRDFRILKIHFNKSAKEIVDSYNSMEPYKSIIESFDFEYFKNLIAGRKNEYTTLKNIKEYV